MDTKNLSAPEELWQHQEKSYIEQEALTLLSCRCEECCHPDGSRCSKDKAEPEVHKESRKVKIILTSGVALSLQEKSFKIKKWSVHRNLEILDKIFNRWAENSSLFYLIHGISPSEGYLETYHSTRDISESSNKQNSKSSLKRKMGYPQRSKDEIGIWYVWFTGRADKKTMKIPFFWK